MLVIAAQMVVVASVILLLYHFRRLFGLALVYVFVGAIQYFQTLLVSTVHVDLFGPYTVSPGSAVLFSSTLFAVLLIYLREGVTCARRLIYSVLLANAILVTLTLMLRVGIAKGMIIAHSDYVRAFEDFYVGMFMAGTLLLMVDTLLLILLYETIALRFRRWPLVVRVTASLWLVLGFDALLFVSLFFAGSPGFTAILIGNLIGKSIAAVLCGAILSIYLSWSRPRKDRATDFAPQDMTDVFSIVTYRERVRTLQQRAARREQQYNRDRRRAEEQLRKTQDELRQAQKVESMGRLAGGIAHDFNNILTAILGYADLILDRPAEEANVSQYASEIRSAAERAAELTHQLLAFSRKQVLNPQVLNVNDLIASMSDMLQRLLGERIELLLDLSDSLPLVKADAAQLQQVILNLTINSHDAMPAGGTLRIETASQYISKIASRESGRLTPGSYVSISVIDSGTGMDAETLKRVFEPFFTTKEIGKGTGLGLSTVHGVVEQSGGVVLVDSELNVGSIFRVLLPIAQEPVVGESTRQTEPSCKTASGIHAE